MTDALRVAAERVLDDCTEAVAGWQSLAPAKIRNAAVEALDELRAALAEPQEPASSMLRDAVLKLNAVWNAGAAESAIADQLDLCRRLALQQVVAEPQEPVAWIDDSKHPKHRLYLQSATEKRLYGSLRPLYPHPAPQRQPLTAQKIRRIVDETVKLATPHEHIVFREVARAIERAHGIE